MFHVPSHHVTIGLHQEKQVCNFTVPAGTCDGKLIVHPRNLLVRGLNLNGGFLQAKLLSFSRNSL